MPIMPRGPLSNREAIKVATTKIALVRDNQCFASSRAILAPSAANPALAKPAARASMHTWHPLLNTRISDAFNEASRI